MSLSLSIYISNESNMPICIQAPPREGDRLQDYCCQGKEQEKFLRGGEESARGEVGYDFRNQGAGLSG